ncbi:hypothetical protein DRZ78_03260 [Candidatus Aerophobetes bacterium]|uniref:LiaI-LiaF-like transmembrane region domain-containing protein n=1 Tax=Aerophobetes bacterium TaxID=2030807 RepID=A0A662CZE0_UNCAE|nr:MAG: hypothetical protein DRZ78_03260 [Candidatus Aerophobetes bacterium]
MKKSQIVWSSIFIVLGILLLLLNYGIISWQVVKDWWKLWPLIFIAIGIGIILSTKREKKIEEEEK